MITSPSASAYLYSVLNWTVLKNVELNREDPSVPVMTLVYAKSQYFVKQTFFGVCFGY